MEKRPPSGTTIAAAVLNECAALGLAPKEVYPGIIVTNGGFAKKVLGISPSSFIQSLDARVPVIGAHDAIDPGALQWVAGENINLHYRGNVLPRRKIWLQDGATDKNVLVYSYTGWMSTIAFATSDWNKDAELTDINAKYNAFAKKCGFDPANNDIITGYNDCDANIGYHYDKMRSLAMTGAISVVKMGSPRRFCVRERLIPTRKLTKKEKEALQKSQDKMPSLFDEVVESGALIFMTMEANYLTQHAVPKMDAPVGLSGSIVFRTVDPKKYRKSVRLLTKNAAKLVADRATRSAIRKEKKQSAVRKN